MIKVVEVVPESKLYKVENDEKTTLDGIVGRRLSSNDTQKSSLDKSGTKTRYHTSDRFNQNSKQHTTPTTCTP